MLYVLLSTFKPSEATSNVYTSVLKNKNFGFTTSFPFFNMGRKAGQVWDSGRNSSGTAQGYRIQLSQLSGGRK